jgi:hypothetical protein
VRQFEHGIHIVLDEDHGMVFPQPPQQADYNRGLLGAGAGERLVEK